MKSTMSRAVTLIATVTAVLAASSARASIYAPAAGCVPSNGLEEINNIEYGGSFVANFWDTSARVVCPLPAEKSIGEVADFEISVDDQSPTQSVRCWGAVFDEAGEVVAMTATASSGNGWVGRKVISMSVDASPTSTKSYSVVCWLPPVNPLGSRVMALKVF